MKHAVEVVEAGLANAIQDVGRTGWRSVGVPVGGAADRVLLECANRLVGNEAQAAAIEMPLAGPSLRAQQGPVRVALMGAAEAQVLRADGRTDKLATAHTATLAPGDLLRVGAVRSGVAYLALSGGCLVPPCLGSRSTYARASLGGTQGRALAAGDLIECGAPQGSIATERRASPFAHDDGPIRVMLGPQEDAFAPESVEAFLAQTWRIGRESDRMGLRLDGAPLVLRGSADLTSEGVVPGAIQVPGNGQPIVLFADAQTVGGYPKIATVIRADLPRLAHLRAGATLSFAAVTRAEAFAARARQAEAVARWAATISTFHGAGGIDAAALYELNLVSGMIDAGGEVLPWE